MAEEKIKTNRKVEGLEVLIVEDDEKHLTDAKSTCEQYVNINFTFARSFQEAIARLEQNGYDAVITDVFFPKQKGEEPTYKSAIELTHRLDQMSIPFVFNTSGNHHHNSYSEFLQENPYLDQEDYFLNGRLIESSGREHVESQSISKQWEAAINYTLLFSNLKKLGLSTRKKIARLLSKDYEDKSLTKKMRIILGNSLIEDICNSACKSQLFFWDNDALSVWRKEVENKGNPSKGISIGSDVPTTREEMNKRYPDLKYDDFICFDDKKNCLFSLRNTKEEDEKLFKEIQFMIKDEYIQAITFIRDTITKYKKIKFS